MTLPWLTARPIAHRGLHDSRAGRIENSIGAALAAIAGGYGIECDVQLSADGEAVVFHDFTLDRLTEAAGPVRERSAASLCRLALRGGGGNTIPSLAELLRAVDGRVPVVVEIKSRFDGDLTLARRVVEVVMAAEGCRVVAESFDPDVVAALARLAPTLPRGIVAQSSYEGPEWSHLGHEAKHELANLLHAGLTRPDFLSWRVGDLPVRPRLPQDLRRLPLTAWTVRDEADRRKAAEHADQIVFEGFLPEG